MQIRITRTVKRIYQHGAAAGLGFFVLILHSVNCYAQERDTEYTVAERFSSVFRPEGFPVGSMRL